MRKTTRRRVRTAQLPEDMAVPLYPLESGAFALVSEPDFWVVANHQWTVVNGYAGVQVDRRPLYMHRLIMGVGPSEYVDHINGNRLDNRRSNLRVATAQHNARNRRKPSHRHGRPTTSRYKGVSGEGSVWVADICVGGRKVSLGRFASEELAARAYDEAAREHFGEFARLNFPREGERAA